MAMSTPVDLIIGIIRGSCHGETICGIFACGSGRATTSEVLMAGGNGFAAALKRWRQRRGVSQLDLAGRAEVSQRHLSFLELGRAMPSRDMVVRLAAALDIPLRQHNALLLAAGFAPLWRESALAAPELGSVSV
jgi:DNA-binding XRE family transcriptional regulator